MKAFIVKWHPDRDEITVEYSIEFVDLSAIAQADILRDALFDLEVKYDEAVNKIKEIKNY